MYLIIPYISHKTYICHHHGPWLLKAFIFLLHWFSVMDLNWKILLLQWLWLGDFIGKHLMKLYLFEEIFVAPGLSINAHHIVHPSTYYSWTKNKCGVSSDKNHKKIEYCCLFIYIWALKGLSFLHDWLVLDELPYKKIIDLSFVYSHPFNDGYICNDMNIPWSSFSMSNDHHPSFHQNSLSSSLII